VLVTRRLRVWACLSSATDGGLWSVTSETSNPDANSVQRDDAFQPTLGDRSNDRLQYIGELGSIDGAIEAWAMSKAALDAPC